MIAQTPMQPDIKLTLDPEGVIRQVMVANDMADEPVDDWLGMHWWQTVGEVDSQRVTQFLSRAMDQGSSPFFQVTQRFPSGFDVPVEYMAVRFDEHEGLLAIGRDVRAVAQLQSRLAAAQQTMERGSWRL
ncbi:MAG: PAS domain-containing protein, partial [Chromatiales bacterium]